MNENRAGAGWEAALQRAARAQTLPARTAQAWAAALGFAGLLLCAGCTVGPNWTAPKLFAPKTWQSARGNQALPADQASRPVPDAPDPAWWRIFHDATLTSLEQRAASANISLRLAAMHFLESRSERQAIGGAQYPQAGAGASYAREAVSPKGVFDLLGEGADQGGAAGPQIMGQPGIVPAPDGASRPFDLWQYGFDASWELDLWGRVRRQVEGADARVQAEAEERRGTLVSVMAEVARDYLSLRGIEAETEIGQRAVAEARATLRLAERRRAGEARAADVSLATAVWRLAESRLPALAARQAAMVNALRFLLGEGPGALDDTLGAPASVPMVPPLVPIGVPSELARRRPDIRAAEARLHAATAEIGVAVADFYPRVTLNGEVGLEAMRFADLGSWAARQYGVGPSLSLPVFAGGRLRATLELREEAQQEAALQYQQTVLRAWHEVDNALRAYAEEQAHGALLQTARRAAAEALDLTQRRYARGEAGLVEVLEAQHLAFAADSQAVDGDVSVSEDLVQLYKALGGGWEDLMPTRLDRRN